MTSLLVVIAVALSVSFLCSILEAVFLSVTHSYVALLQKRGDRAGDVLDRLRRNIDEPIAAILTLNTVAHTAGAALGGAIALEVFGSRWMALFSALLTLAILILSEIVPKTIGATYWKRLARPSAHLLLWLTALMKPLIVPLGVLTRFISPRGERPVTISRAEFEVLAQIGRREGEIQEDEWQVLRSVMNLDKVYVGSVMTPRPEVVAVQRGLTVKEAREAMLESGHLRLPVYDGTIDQVIGIIVARDLWKAEAEGVEKIDVITRPALYTTETQPVEDLIRRMRGEQIKMAVVLDEYGGTAGIVTLEDLIEEIVGEIQDEHELEPVPIMEVAGGEVVIRGDVPVRAVNDRFGLALSVDEYDTLGGFVFGVIGRVPEAGDVLKIDGGSLVVERVDGRRVVSVRFLPAKS